MPNTRRQLVASQLNCQAAGAELGLSKHARVSTARRLKTFELLRLEHTHTTQQLLYPHSVPTCTGKNETTNGTKQ